ncbi:MAG: redoxin domain-containing protein [Pirellulales bacterium]|nr:redoxin domain-containing protein [Pirellulales bacterium]
MHLASGTFGRLVGGFAGLFVLCTSLPRLDAAEATRVGRKIDDFSLRDFRGKQHSLGELSDEKLLVVVFLGTDCPLVKLYAPRLQELATEYAERGVEFVAINSNLQDTVTKIGAFAQRAGIKFPILKDADSAIADRFGAERTPEAFVLDGDGVVQYRGRIDDQFGVGFQRPQVGRKDLAIAIDELLAGKPVSMPETAAPGCLIGRAAKVAPTGDVTYTKHIASVLQARCQECHRSGEIAPFPLTSYDEVVGWAPMICEVVDQGRMPPWFANPEYGKFANDCRLSDDEKQLIHTWVANGCPEGNRSDLPAPREFVDGWRIKPDQIVYMDEKAFQVPAEGVVDYQNFSVDLQVTEDKWLQAAEARPDNRSVVHHIVCWISPPGSGSGQISFGNRLVAVYAPGTPPWSFPEGTAIPVPAGSRISFQMHYTPNGTAAEDRSYIGLVWADPQTVKRKAQSLMAPQLGINIPPGADNHEIRSRFKVKRDMLLLNYFPHMHLRGKDFRFEVEYPDGTREILLDVPRYDFNWQLRYDLVEPKLVPKGSRIHCVAHFDNSAANPFNPDPTQTVRFGEQTWEEMMVGFFTAASTEEDAGEADEEAEHGDDGDDGGDDEKPAADGKPRRRGHSPSKALLDALLP